MFRAIVQGDKMKSVSLQQWKFDSKIGPLYLVASEKGLKGVYVEKQNITLLEVKDTDSESKEVKKILEVNLYPTLFIIENGKPQSKIIGADNIKKTLDI